MKGPVKLNKSVEAESSGSPVEI